MSATEIDSAEQDGAGVAVFTPTMRQQADQMLPECRILEILSKHGDVRPFGSYELDLMAWPEIDIWVVNPNFQPHMAWDIVKDLSQAVSPTVVFVANQIDHALGLNPADAVLVDFRFKHRDTYWKLDIGVAAGSSHADLFAMNDTIKETLTPSTASLIRKIKELSVDSPRYLKARWGFTSPAKNFSSYHIYLSVLRDGVSTPQEFANYLLKHRGIDVRANFASLPDRDCN